MAVSIYNEISGDIRQVSPLVAIRSGSKILQPRANSFQAWLKQRAKRKSFKKQLKAEIRQLKRRLNKLPNYLRLEPTTVVKSRLNQVKRTIAEFVG